MNRTARIARSALPLVFLFGAGFGLTLLWQIAVAAVFGTAPELDAFWIAFSVPKSIADLFHLGILTLASIVVLNLPGLRDDAERARLTSAVWNAVLLGTVALVIALATGAGRFIAWLGPGLDPAQRTLAVGLLRVLSPYLLLTAGVGLAAGVLHARGRFLPFASARVLGLVAQIAALFLLARRFGVSALVVGAFAGAATMLVICVAALRGIGFRYRRTLTFHGAEARSVVAMLGGMAGVMLIDTVNRSADRFFASQLAAGSVSVLEYAWRFDVIASQLVGLAVALPSFAMMAVQTTPGQVGELRATLRASARLVALLTLPVIVALVVLRNPLTSLWLERGAFSAADAHRVAALIPLLAPAFLCRAFGSLVLFGLLATRRATLLLAITAVECGLRIALDRALAARLGLEGIALAAGVSMTLSAIAQWTFLLRGLR